MPPMKKAGDTAKTSNREAEIAELSALYGAPAHRQCVLKVDPGTLEWWTSIQPRRRGEVVLFIYRTNGHLILHTKDFYPAGTLRVPSGGIKKQEALADAAQREAREETGLEVAIERFLAVIDFEFQHQDRSLHFHSYLFQLREMGGELKVKDERERISAFVEILPSELTSVAESLENMPPAWRDWGRFRALPHRVAAELLPGFGTSESCPSPSQ
ncbi:MAG: NUDIX hydrolase [Anaerolineales bacterium]|nr:MAG: NUDIX hydrolase [Anaerolineales bacterium]